jgi:hypothetical protein
VPGPFKKNSKTTTKLHTKLVTPIHYTLYGIVNRSMLIPVKNEDTNRLTESGRNIELAVCSGVNPARDNMISDAG